MDWITGTIEAIGIVIFCTWLVVPIREFREIFLRMKGEKRADEKEGRSKA